MKHRGPPPMRRRSNMETAIAEGRIRPSNSCTEKRRYTVHEVLVAKRRLGRKGKSLTIYHCRFCGRYHLTSTA